ncbi:MAG: DMT family transporter [Sulfolobales archaeon]|nr:DMT family transporter [Sulfolobales archaeon]MDW7969423.1 DMT family transporter [Sulfolobales archaeon]
MWAGAYVVVASILWSTIGIATMYSSDIILMLFTRTIIIAAVSSSIFRSKSRASLVSGLVLGTLFISYVASVALTGVGPAAYLLYTAPLWSTLIALKYGEKINKLTLLGMSLILVSVFLMGLDSLLNNTINMYGLFLGLLTGFIYGSYISLVRYFSARGYDKEVSWGAMPYSLIPVAPLTLLYLTPTHKFTSANIYNSVIAGSYLAIFCTLIPYRLFAKGARHLKASTSSVIASIEPVFASLWDYVIFGRIPTELLLLAYVLMTSALILVSTEK